MLLLILCVMTLIALMFIVMPMIPHPHGVKKIALPIFILPIIAFVLYLGFGSYAKVSLMQMALENSPENLIHRFNVYLSTHPEDKKAWYLLGKLYLNEGRYTEADVAFKKS